MPASYERLPLEECFAYCKSGKKPADAPDFVFPASTRRSPSPAIGSAKPLEPLERASSAYWHGIIVGVFCGMQGCPPGGPGGGGGGGGAPPPPVTIPTSSRQCTPRPKRRRELSSA